MGHFHGHRNGVYIYISHYMGNFHGHGVPQIQVIFMGIRNGDNAILCVHFHEHRNSANTVVFMGIETVLIRLFSWA